LKLQCRENPYKAVGRVENGAAWGLLQVA
jgi:hypothetical protein